MTESVLQSHRSLGHDLCNRSTGPCEILADEPRAVLLVTIATTRLAPRSYREVSCRVRAWCDRWVGSGGILVQRPVRLAHCSLNERKEGTWGQAGSRVRAAVLVGWGGFDRPWGAKQASLGCGSGREKRAVKQHQHQPW